MQFPSWMTSDDDSHSASYRYDLNRLPQFNDFERQEHQCNIWSISHHHELIQIQISHYLWWSKQLTSRKPASEYQVLRHKNKAAAPTDRVTSSSGIVRNMREFLFVSKQCNSIFPTGEENMLKALYRRANFTWAVIDSRNCNKQCHTRSLEV